MDMDGYGLSVFVCERGRERRRDGERERERLKKAVEAEAAAAAATRFNIFHNMVQCVRCVRVKAQMMNTPPPSSQAEAPSLYSCTINEER